MTRDLHSTSGTRIDGTHLDILLLTLPACMLPSSPTSLRIPDNSAAAEEKEKNIQNKEAKRQPNRDHRSRLQVDRLNRGCHCNTLAGGTKHSTGGTVFCNTLARGGKCCTGGTVGCGGNRLIDDLRNFVFRTRGPELGHRHHGVEVEVDYLLLSIQRARPEISMVYLEGSYVSDSGFMISRCRGEYNTLPSISSLYPSASGTSTKSVS